MLTVLQVLGAFALVFLVLGGAVAAYFIMQIRQALRAAKHTASCPPCRVSPEPEPNPQWRNPANINQYAAEFRALGFEEVGAFSIPQFSGLLMLGLVHPTERYYGVIYDHTKIAPSFEINCDFEDQTGVCASSSKLGATLDKRPGHPILWLGNDRVSAVFEAVRNHPQPTPRLPVSNDAFLPRFKKNYAEGMNWRLKKGGVSREEIRRQAERKGRKLDAAALEQSYQNLRAAYVRELQAGCLAQYLDDQQLSAADWERIQGRVLTVPETLEPAEVTQAIQTALPLDEEQRHQLGKLEKSFGQTALDIVDCILAENRAALGLKKLGEVQQPVRACVLLAPSARSAA